MELITESNHYNNELLKFIEKAETEFLEIQSSVKKDNPREKMKDLFKRIHESNYQLSLAAEYFEEKANISKQENENDPKIQMLKQGMLDLQGLEKIYEKSIEETRRLRRMKLKLCAKRAHTRFMEKNIDFYKDHNEKLFSMMMKDFDKMEKSIENLHNREIGINEDACIKLGKEIHVLSKEIKIMQGAEEELTVVRKQIGQMENEICHIKAQSSQMEEEMSFDEKALNSEITALREKISKKLEIKKSPRNQKSEQFFKDPNDFPSLLDFLEKNKKHANLFVKRKLLSPNNPPSKRSKNKTDHKISKKEHRGHRQKGIREKKSPKKKSSSQRSQKKEKNTQDMQEKSMETDEPFVNGVVLMDEDSNDSTSHIFFSSLNINQNDVQGNELQRTSSTRNLAESPNAKKDRSNQVPLCRTVSSTNLDREESQGNIVRRTSSSRDLAETSKSSDYNHSSNSQHRSSSLDRANSSNKLGKKETMRNEMRRTNASQNLAETLNAADNNYYDNSLRRTKSFLRIELETQANDEIANQVTPILSKNFEKDKSSKIIPKYGDQLQEKQKVPKQTQSKVKDCENKNDSQLYAFRDIPKNNAEPKLLKSKKPEGKSAVEITKQQNEPKIQTDKSIVVDKVMVNADNLVNDRLWQSKFKKKSSSKKLGSRKKSTRNVHQGDKKDRKNESMDSESEKDMVVEEINNELPSENNVEMNELTTLNAKDNKRDNSMEVDNAPNNVENVQLSPNVLLNPENIAMEQDDVLENDPNIEMIDVDDFFGSDGNSTGELFNKSFELLFGSSPNSSVNLEGNSSFENFFNKSNEFNGSNEGEDFESMNADSGDFFGFGNDKDDDNFFSSNSSFTSNEGTAEPFF